jgi:hypothetical protein
MTWGAKDLKSIKQLGIWIDDFHYPNQIGSKTKGKGWDAQDFGNHKIRTGGVTTYWNTDGIRIQALVKWNGGTQKRIWKGGIGISSFRLA